MYSFTFSVRREAQAMLIGLALLGIAFTGGFLITHLVGTVESLLPLLLVPTAVATWLGGRRPGWVLVALTILIWEGYFFSSRGSLAPDSMNGLLQVGFFLAELVAVVWLVDARREAEDRIRHQATHDHLTGLPNRALLWERLENFCVDSGMEEEAGAVLMVDLDNFKTINDTYGHPAGDFLLKEVALRLRRAVRRTDTVARMGGDEFVVLLNGEGSREGVERVAKQIGQAFSQPIRYGRHTLSTGISIGIALSPEHGKTADILLKAADSALYEAKRSGRGAYKFAP